MGQVTYTSPKTTIVKERRKHPKAKGVALSTKEQIQNQVEKDLQPKLDELLARKVKPNAMQNKKKAIKKERNVKFSSSFQKSKLIKTNLRD